MFEVVSGHATHPCVFRLVEFIAITPLEGLDLSVDDSPLSGTVGGEGHLCRLVLTEGLLLRVAADLPLPGVLHTVPEFAVCGLEFSLFL